MMTIDEWKEEIASAKQFLLFNEDDDSNHEPPMMEYNSNSTTVRSALDRLKIIYPTYTVPVVRLIETG